MSQEIVIQGSAREIAERIANFPGQILRAVLIVEEECPPKKPVTHSNIPTSEDAWTQDFRRWAAGHRVLPAPIDDSRESIYEERLE